MLQDLLTISFLVFLEGILSADNALVLAILVKHLPQRLRARALLYGLAGALVFRLIAILLARWILQIWWLQGLGALYLSYLTVEYFWRRGEAEKLNRATARRGFWKTVIAVELTDIAFAIDSVLVAVAVSDKVWVVYTGAIIGTLLMRLAATVIVGLLQRYPQMESMAYLLVGWIAIRLFAETWESFSVVVLKHAHEQVLLPDWLFWIVMIVILAVGSVWAYRHPAQEIAKPDESPIGQDRKRA